MLHHLPNHRILMITPFHINSRGNKLTSERLHTCLKRRGWAIDLLSLESNDWQAILQKALEEKRYSLVHGLHISHFGRVISAFPALTELPLLLTTTGTDVNYDIKIKPKQDILRTLNQVQKIVIFNDSFRKIFHELYPEITEKLVTIPQGVWLVEQPGPERSQLGLSPQDFVFILPSGFRPVKNLELAINALEKLQPDFPYLRLLILGAIIDREYGDSIFNHIKDLPWVIYPGEFPHNQMYTLLSTADVVLNTSRSEGQPQAALEAMSLGKPVLLTAVPGNNNIIENGQEGYYIKNEEELIAAARELMLNDNLRQQMGINAQRLVEEKFSTSKEVDAYEALYHQLLSVSK